MLWKVLHLCLSFISCCFSVIQLCLAICNPMDCGMPGSSVLHYLPEFAQIHVLELMMLSDHLILCHPLSFCLQSFPASGSFPVSWLFTSGGQSIGASGSFLSMNIQDWFPLGLTGLISLQSKGLSRVFSNITIQKHQFFSVQPSLWSNSHIHTWLLEKAYLWLYGPLSAKKCLSFFNVLCRCAIASLPRVSTF